MLQLHPFMDARRFSSFAMHFNSCGKGGVRQSCTNFRSLMGKCYSRGGIVMMSQKDPQLRPYIDGKGEEGLWSVIIPSYNRLPILSKCLKAVEEQRNYRESGIKEYEVIVVDDGSTDGTIHFLLSEDEGHLSCEECIMSSKRFPHVKVLQQNHGGAARARNLGFLHSRGSVIVFIDSDLVVTPDFLKEHARVLYQCFLTDGDDATFTYGRVINTHNFENPQSEPFKFTDNSTAFFATGNIAISRRRLAQAATMLSQLSEGPFDTKFSEYGWEDLELGVRLKNGGAKLKHAPAAVGYHWHPSFSYDQLPMQIEQWKKGGKIHKGFTHLFSMHNRKEADPIGSSRTQALSKTRSRVSVRSSIKVQENKLLTEMNSLTTSSSKRQEHSVSKGVNALDLSTKEKPFKSRKGLPVPSKCATVVPKTETKESPLAVSDSTCTSSKPFLHQRALAVKTEKVVAVEAKVKSSRKKESSVSFEDSSTRSQIKDNASNKDALLTAAGSINSMVLVTPEHPNHGHRSKLNMLTSSSYWLDQIKISESAGKHAISLGFFRLALESAAEPLQRLHDELKEYALKYNLLEFGELAKDVLQRYGVLEEIMSADSSGKLAELDASAEGTFSEPKVFMPPIHEMSSVCTDNAENSSIGETTMNTKVDCPSIVETEGLSIVSELKNVTDSFSEKSKVYHLKMDKDDAREDDNIKESVNDKSSGMLSGLMGSKTQVLPEEHLMEEKAIGNEFVQQSILNQKSCIENRNLNETEKVVSVSSSMIGGTVSDKKNAILKGSRCRTMPGTGSQLHARKSSKLNSAEKAGASKTLRSTTRHSCTSITSTKKEERAKKNARQDEKKGTNLNEFCPSDLFSTDNGEEKDTDNRPFQTMDQVNQCEDIKGFASEYIENRESRPNDSISECNGLDILNMSVDMLMDEVVSCIMSSMDDCTDSPKQVQGRTLNSLEDNIVDTVESNSRDKITSPSTSSIPDINHPFGIVCDPDSNNKGSSIPSTEVAADHDKEEMREDLDDISCAKNNAKELGADISRIIEEEQEKSFENGANETVQLGAENDGIERNREVELRKSKPHFTKSKFQGSKAVTGKGGIKNDQKNVISNSNKENIIDNICGVPLMQTESSGNLGKVVKALDGSYEGNCQNPANCTPGSIRRSTRLRGRAAS